MKTIPKTPDLIDRLQSFEPFQDISPEALQWMIEQGEYKLYDQGDRLYYPGMPVNHMQIIMEGEYMVHLEQQGEVQEIATFESGNITGVLPFSRMKESRAAGIALSPTYVLEIPKTCFTEMVNVSYELVQNLVAVMSTRIRDFSQVRYQNEKLAALGKLSAGLAHELNNPASAMVRNAEILHDKIHKTPDSFKAVMTMRVTPEETDAINAILFSKIEQGINNQQSTLDRSEREDDLMDWLEDQGIFDAEDIVETFADYEIQVEELEQIKSIIKDRDLPAILWWLESTLSLEVLVSEMQESASQIKNLIESIKSYSHMDRGRSMETIDIHDGIASTLIMLKHKLKQKNIQLEKDFQSDLPKIQAFPGDLNQVWTNLIDNALDAMDAGGHLTIKTYSRRQFLCVDINDDGSGIPEEIQERIFDPFFTTKKLGEGTGVGLDIVKKIIKRHKGTVKLDSRPGKTTFEVCFPI